ncbi:MAG: Daunorubicin/doxorubicin resistance ATP-binding protein DrrA [Planctomycetes bacterium]|nr:Daunorubicin/doxorubicin resistance ATP-binding protein DrrA [Planctomycetota bacterium]
MSGTSERPSVDAQGAAGRGAVVSCSGIVKQYGDRAAVDGVSLRIPAGTCYALLGPNGAGKSTLSRVIGGMARRDGGELSVFGMDPALRPSDVKARLGWVMQEDALDEELDLAGNMRVWGSFFGMPRSAVEERMPKLLALLGLEGREKAAIQSLSGGLRRRLVLARALLSDPSMVLLDEPTTGLDPQVRHVLWSALRALRAEGMTLLLTTHYMEEAEQLADRVGVLDRGKLVGEGSPQELLARHVRRFVLVAAGAGAESEAAARACGADVRKHGDVIAAYHDDEAALRACVAQGRFVRAQVRPSNLEDVFLELTGRALDA